MKGDINVWKIASRWNNHGEDNEEDKIIDLFLENKIVFAGRSTDYIKQVKKDDIIAVSDGVLVKAVAKATNTPQPLSTCAINELEDYYYGDEQTIAISVEIYKLETDEIFGYTRGTFHKVHGGYKDVVVGLFEKKSNKIRIKKTETRLKEIHLKNYNGIIETKIQELPDKTNWIFLTGLNGFGKTSILRAIMVGLQGETILNSQENLPEGTSITFSSSKVRGNIQKNIIERKTIEHENFIRFSDIENIAAYGTKRSDIKDTKEISEVHENLFEYKSIELTNFEIRYKDWRLFPKENEKKIENFENIMKTLFPRLNKIDISNKTSEVNYFELTSSNEELPPVTFNKLGMGMRSVMAMISDIIFRFTKGTFEFEFDENKGINLTGLVIIDELDNHLHPKSQCELVEKLTEIFPKIQFIASTHSPIPVLGAPENTVIINVERDKEKGITAKKLDIDFKNLLPNSILSSPIFGLTDFVPKANRDLSKLRTEDSFDEVLFNQEVERRFDEMLNDEN